MQFSLLGPPGSEPTDEVQDISAVTDGSGLTWMATAATNGTHVIVWTERDGHITGTATIDAPAGYAVYSVEIMGRNSDLVFYGTGHKIAEKPRPNVPMRFVWPGVFTPIGSQPPVVPPTPPPAPPPAPVPTFDISTLTNALNTDHNLRTALGNLLLTTLANGINSDPGVRGALVDVISANVRSTLNVFFSEPKGALFNSAPLFQRLMDCGWLTAIKFAPPLPTAEPQAVTLPAGMEPDDPA
jgi:hypothetical protein